ncbi:uncharacterized protein EAF01_010856 [Botrytis porri]|uniref:uncharacterized protein n=1 Tax=Botrytis porri TaxID=87229 RepID=UPI0018FF571C|nr:uncharacterized protein EAF01_010856 [Botrytis porri]KAF7889363.1 hypothetical protein EAF01_010856 [Botrytis porri]
MKREKGLEKNLDQEALKKEQPNQLKGTAIKEEEKGKSKEKEEGEQSEQSKTFHNNAEGIK